MSNMKRIVVSYSRHEVYEKTANIDEEMLKYVNEYIHEANGKIVTDKMIEDMMDICVYSKNKEDSYLYKNEPFYYERDGKNFYYVSNFYDQLVEAIDEYFYNEVDNEEPIDSDLIDTEFDIEDAD